MREAQRQTGVRDQKSAVQAPLPRLELGFLAPEAKVISTTLQGQPAAILMLYQFAFNAKFAKILHSKFFTADTLSLLPNISTNPFRCTNEGKVDRWRRMLNKDGLRMVVQFSKNLG